MATTSTGIIGLNFNPSDMFTFTNGILSSLMPIVYVILGVSLAFVIINALKNAFR